MARAGVPLGVNLFAIDRDEVARAVSKSRGCARAHVRRELPSTLVVDVVEREAACAVAFGALYLADARGNVFKRATPDEAAALPVVTGIARDDYLAEPERRASQLRAGAARDRRVAEGRRPAPALGEMHVDRIAGVTVYTRARRRRAARRRRRHAAGAAGALRRRRRRRSTKRGEAAAAHLSWTTARDRTA